MSKENFSFQAEAKEVLELMIHSVYSNKEIFLRELVSNASDALDKRRFEALTDASLLPAGEKLEIRLTPDKDKRTLTITDNGIGMRRAEVIENIGTIARSGTREMIKTLKQQQEKHLDLIGQFGVGFYSCFMVADEVELLTRRAGENQATLWKSKGDGAFTVEEGQRETVGTTITLRLKKSDEDDGLKDFADPFVLEQIVKKYSDFVTYPIVLEGGGDERTLNSMKPIWARAQGEVKDEEYQEFYRHLSHDWLPPLKTIPFRAEGQFEYQALLFLPQQAPHDLYFRDAPRGLQLYVKRVMIMERCEELLPTYLRFVRGVVDAADLPLNVSREILQNNRQMALMKKRLTKKVVDSLQQLFDAEPEKFRGFYAHFAPLLKEGVTTDGDNKEKLLSLLLFRSSASAAPPTSDAPKSGGAKEDDVWTTLKDYVARMKPEQEYIYYLPGESITAAARSPHLEAFKEKNLEVLFMLDAVDELVLQHVPDFEGKKFKSIAKGDFDLKSKVEAADTIAQREEAARQFAPLLVRLKSELENEVSDVKLSERLRASAACLVGGEHDLSPHLERLLAQTQGGAFVHKRVLELNPQHPAVAALKQRFDLSPGDKSIADGAYLLYGQALLLEGSPLPDPVRFGQLIGEIMAR